MNKTLLETGLVKALTTSVCPPANWDELYINHDAQLTQVVDSTLPPVETIRHLDYLIATLAAIRACGVQKKCTLSPR